MLIRLLVKLFGGIWVIKEKHKTCKINYLKRLYGFIYNYSLQLKGSWISLNTKFHGEPCFPHGIYSIFISGGVVMGVDCVIFQGVTIGSNTLLDSKGLGAPTIGDNCYIGAGAKIIGKVTIGDNVRIGANAVVYKDVPDNCVVISGEQNIIPKKQQMDNRFYHMYKGEWVFFERGEWCKLLNSEKIELLNRLFK